MDKGVNGSILTSWYVNPDDSLNETFLLTATATATATGAGADGVLGTSDDEVATSIFTDSIGSYKLTWTAADPAVNNAPYLPTYTKISPAEYLAAEFTYPSGRTDLPSSNPIDNAVAFGPTSAENDRDAVTSLAPKDMALGQIVPFEMIINVNGDTTPENGVITFTTDLLAKTTSGGNFGFDTNYKIIAAFVDTGDVATVDPGNNAKVDSFSSTIVGAGTSNERIQGTYQVSGLNNGDNIVVELWAVLKDSISSTVTGNVQTSLVSAHTGPATTPIDKFNSINTGNQTVPLLKVGEFFTSKADLSVIKSDSTDASTNPSHLTSGSDPDPTNLKPGDTFTYTILAKNNSADTVANGVVVKDTLDANVTFISATSSGAAAGNVVTWNVGSLSPGESQVLTVTVKVNDNAPTDSLTQDLLNSVSITSITQDPTPGNNTDTEPTNLDRKVIIDPAIAIIKTTNGADGLTISEGNAVTWEYAVSNSGNVDLSNVNVVDDNGTPVDTSDDFSPTLISGDDGDGILENNETWIFQATGVAHTGGYSNIGTVSGEYSDSNNVIKTVDSSDPSSYVGQNLTPSITIDKTGPDTINEGGANVIYNFTITADATNASTDPVTITSLSDNTFSATDNTALFAAALAKYQETHTGATEIVLNPSESLSFSFDPTGNLVLNAGEKHTNTVTVEGKDDENTPVSDTDDHTVTAVDVAPNLSIDKTVDANKDGIFHDSEVLTTVDGKADYLYVVKNTSPASTDSELVLTSFVDDRGTSATGDDVNLLNGFITGTSHGNYYIGGDADNDYKLDANESWSFKATGLTVPIANATPVNKNTATVKATDDEGTEGTASDTASVPYTNILPTGTTIGQYISGTAQSFQGYYASQGGVIQYGVKSGAISSTNPGVFFYDTGLSNAIKGTGSSMQIFIDQSDPNASVNAFGVTKNDVKLYKITSTNNGIIDAGDTFTQVNLSSSQIVLGGGTGAADGAAAGDVTINFTPESGSLYVVSVKYDTNGAIGSSIGSAKPTVKYTFDTKINGGAAVESASVTLAAKFAALTLNGDAILDSHAPVLREGVLHQVAAKAISFWSAHGASTDEIVALKDIDFAIRDLTHQGDGRTLAEFIEPGTIVIDDDAAGYGWSIGTGQVNPHKVDLYSTHVHEMGHALGLDHDVLGADSAVGQRMLPEEEISLVGTNFQHDLPL